MTRNGTARLVWLYAGHDAGVCGRYRAAPVLWLLGYPASRRWPAAWRRSPWLSRWAPPSNTPDPGPVLGPLCCITGVSSRGVAQPRAASTRPQASITVATDSALTGRIGAMPLRGWALAARGQGEEGRARSRRAWRPAGARVARDGPYHLALLAEVSTQVGQTAAGLEALADALATVDQSTARLVGGGVASAGANCCCGTQGDRQGRRKPRCSGPWTWPAARRPSRWSCGAVMSLSRLWQQQGKRAEACGCWHRSTVGSPRALTPPTCRRQRSCWRSCPRVGLHDDSHPTKR